MNDPAHTAFVTYAWLIGTSIGMLAILIPVIWSFGRGKVNKEMCKLMHDSSDKVTGLMQESLKAQGQLLQMTHDAVVRIEVLQKENQNKK